MLLSVCGGHEKNQHSRIQKAYTIGVLFKVVCRYLADNIEKIRFSYCHQLLWFSSFTIAAFLLAWRV